MLATISEFVYDPSSASKLVFNIDSHLLKKALSQAVQARYMHTGVFTEYSQAIKQVIVKKGKSFKQENFTDPHNQKSATDKGANLFDKEYGFTEVV